MLCVEVFKYQSHLTHHLSAVHNLHITCDICHKSFTTDRAYVKHRQQIHEGRYLHVCPMCSKGFTSGSDLQGHINGHNGIRPFVCTDCGLSFFHKKTLTRHIRVRHGHGK